MDGRYFPGRGILVLSAILFLSAGAFALIAVGGLALWLYPTARRVDAASATLLDCKYRDSSGRWKGNGACLQSQALAITGTVRDIGKQFDKGLPALVKSAQQTSANAAAESKAMVKATEAVMPIIERAGKTVDSAKEGADALANLVKHTDNSLNGEGGSLPTLTLQIPKLGTAVDALTGEDGVLSAAAAAIAQGGKVMADPNIPKTFAALASAGEHVDKTAEHLQGAAAETKEALGYVRDSLKPQHLTFWQTVESAALSAIPGGLVQLFLHFHPQNVRVVNQSPSPNQ